LNFVRRQGVHDLLEHIRNLKFAAWYLLRGVKSDQLSHRTWTSPGHTIECTGKAKLGRDMVIRLCLSLNTTLSVQQMQNQF
jgi:hypothetical protein